MVEYSQSCPCRGRIRAAEHDAERFELEAAMASVTKDALEAKEATTRALRYRAQRSAANAARMAIDAKPCHVCGGTGRMVGNGSAARGDGSNARIPFSGERVG